MTRTVPAVLALLLATPRILTGNYFDFDSYYAAVHRAMATGSPYASWQLDAYLLPSAARGQGFVYPPTALPLLAPFAIHPVGGPLLNYLGLLALWEVVWRLLGRPRLLWSCLWATLLVANPLTLWSLNSGQVALFVAAGFGLIYLAPAAGWVGVIGGLLKIFPGAAIVYAIRKRMPLWRPLLVGVAITMAVAIWLPGTFMEYVAVLANGEPGCRSAVPSFACVGLPLVGYGLAVLLAVAALLVSTDEMAFALVGWAATVPVPDPYPPYLLVPLVTSLPLVMTTLRRSRVAPPILSQ